MFRVTEGCLLLMLLLLCSGVALSAQAGNTQNKLPKAKQAGLDIAANTTAHPPSHPNEAPDQAQAMLAVVGPAMLKALGGQLYSPRYENGTPLGEKIAAAHRELVASFAQILQNMASEQGRALSLLAQLDSLQIRQASLLKNWAEQNGQDKSDWLQREQRLLESMVSFHSLNKLQSGATEAALANLPPPEAASESYAGVEVLVSLFAGVTIQQDLLLDQMDRHLVSTLAQHLALAGEDSPLSGTWLAKLEQLNRGQVTLFTQLVDVLTQSNAYWWRLLQMQKLFAQFDGQVAAAYAKKLAQELPRVQSQVNGALLSLPDSKALRLTKKGLDFVEANQRRLKKQTGVDSTSLMWQRLADLMVPPAHAGVTDFLQKTAQKAWELSSPVAQMEKTRKLLQEGVRYSVAGVKEASQRIALTVSMSTYSPFRVTQSGSDLTDDPRLRRQHDQKNYQGFRETCKKMNNEFMEGYYKGRVGVDAVQQGVKDIDRWGGCIKNLLDCPQEDDKDKSGAKSGGQGFLSQAYGFMAGLAYGVVTDASKGILVLSDPQATAGEQAMATWDVLTGFSGVSVFEKTGLKFFSKAVGRETIELLSKKSPQLLKTAYKSFSDLLGPLLKKGGEARKRVAKYTSEKTKQFLQSDFAEKYLNVKYQWGLDQSLDALKDYIGNFGPEGLFDNWANNQLNAGQGQLVKKLTDQKAPSTQGPEPMAVRVSCTKCTRGLEGAARLGYKIHQGRGPFKVTWTFLKGRVVVDRVTREGQPASGTLSWSKPLQLGAVYRVRAKATDADGHHASSTYQAIQVTGLGVAISSKRKARTLTGKLALAVRAHGGTGPFTYRFKVEGPGGDSALSRSMKGKPASYSYTWRTALSQPGIYKIYVKATDAAGQTSAWSSPLSIKAVEPLTAKLGSDKKSRELEGGVRLSASVQGGQGPYDYLFQIKYPDGRVIKATQSGLPPVHSSQWDTTLKKPGRYRITLQVRDSAGLLSQPSKALSIMVGQALSVSLNTSQPIRGLEGKSLITANVTGGQGPYAFTYRVAPPNGQPKTYPPRKNINSPDRVHWDQKLTKPGQYRIWAKATDNEGLQSGWSRPLLITVEGLAVSLRAEPASTPPGPKIILNAKVTGGLGPYEYLLKGRMPSGKDSTRKYRHDVDTLSLGLPSKDLKPGKYTFWMRAKDKREQTSPWSPPATVTIEGLAVSLKVNQASVVLGKPARFVVTATGGQAPYTVHIHEISPKGTTKPHVLKNQKAPTAFDWRSKATTGRFRFKVQVEDKLGARSEWSNSVSLNVEPLEAAAPPQEPPTATEQKGFPRTYKGQGTVSRWTKTIKVGKENVPYMGKFRGFAEETKQYGASAEITLKPDGTVGGYFSCYGLTGKAQLRGRHNRGRITSLRLGKFNESGTWIEPDKLKSSSSGTYDEQSLRLHLDWGWHWVRYFGSLTLQRN
ncbi:MAG: hypothetical protein K9K65_05255 [Desulfarculaceae bacterium]|nr:hypothetical protein [Desulfarculaceae bacterium]MCF8046982.1 hypothetical protein [Desulfarculaceae bacterium]MCF8063603.1 hypothetical protein [Desulfarculaceae bacterium]MCF8097230.1 hypothetical protein [Desulfarculaceae bacterium]